MHQRFVASSVGVLLGVFPLPPTASFENKIDGKAYKNALDRGKMKDNELPAALRDDV